MTRVAPLLLPALLALGCARAEPIDECDPESCRAACLPRVGSCATGACLCSTPEVPTDADADADAPRCDDPTCADDCRTRGFAGGACLGVTCQCSGAADGDADADLPDDAPPDDAGPEDAPADETTPAELGDPCSVDDLVEQRLCGDGMKCTFFELAGARPDAVCDRAGRREGNATCASYSLTDTCLPGHLCLNDGTASRCRRFCRGDADCATLGTGAGCLIGINFGGTTVDGIKVCTRGCDLALHTGCEADQACRLSVPEAAARTYTDCSGLGTGTQGADCAARGDGSCARGYQCFTLTGGSQQCLFICRLARFGSDCPGAAVDCLDIGDPTGTYGACL